MTSEEYRQIDSLLTHQDIYGFAKRMCEKYKIDPIKDYPQTTESEVMKSAARKRMYIFKASELLRRAFFLGAMENEILCISEFLIVLMESMDHSLDYTRCEKELKIGDLEKKYDMSAFYNMDIPVEELKRWLKQNGGYGVNVKNEED